MMDYDAYRSFILREEITSGGKPLVNPDEEDPDDAIPDFDADADAVAQPAPAEPDPNAVPAPEGDPNANTMQAPPPDPNAAPAPEGDPNAAAPVEGDPNAMQAPPPDPNAAPAPDPSQQPGMDPNSGMPQQQDPAAPVPADGGQAGALPPDPNAAPEDGEEVPDFGADADQLDGAGAENNPAGGDPGTDPNAAAQDPNAMSQDPNAMPPMQPDEIKQMETDMFSSLRPEQVEMKKTELKEQFVKLYETIDNTIERLTKVDRSSSDILSINFVVKKLMELKEILKDALIKKYDSNTYVENMIILQRHMAIFMALTNIMQMIGESKKNQKNVDRSKVYKAQRRDDRRNSRRGRADNSISNDEEIRV